MLGDLIDPVITQTGTCPACGAPVDVTRTARCPACGFPLYTHH